MKKGKNKPRYLFMVGVLDTYTHQTCFDVKNLSKEEARIVIKELLLKYG